MLCSKDCDQQRRVQLAGSTPGVEEHWPKVSTPSLINDGTENTLSKFVDNKSWKERLMHKRVVLPSQRALDRVENIRPAEVPQG